MTPSLWRKRRRTNESLDENEGGEWKSWLKTQHLKNKDHGIQSHHFMAYRWGNYMWETLFWGSKITTDNDCSHDIKKILAPWKKCYDQPRPHVKKQRHCFANKSLSSQSYGFPVIMYGCELDYKESWALKNWCFWTEVLEKTLESPLDCKEIQPVHPKGNQSWIVIGRTDAEAEVPILCPPDGKNWLIGKDPDAGKNWRRDEKGTTED